MTKRHFHQQHLHPRSPVACRWVEFKFGQKPSSTIASPASQAAFHLSSRPIVEGVLQSVHPEVTHSPIASVVPVTSSSALLLFDEQLCVCCLLSLCFSVTPAICV